VWIFIRLGHFLGRILKAHDLRSYFSNISFRDRKYVAVKIIKADSDISCKLQVLHLVNAYRNHISLVEQDIRSHKNRIGEKSCIDVIRMFCCLVLKLSHSVQLSHISKTVEDPGKLRMS